MPMVSKLTSAFRTWIGSDGSQSSPVPRKRTWASTNKQHAEQDILETPEPKRIKHNHENVTSPIGKMANWIKQKASTFGENYFFRPVGMQNGYDNHMVNSSHEPQEANTKPDLRRRPIQRSPMATTSKDPIMGKTTLQEDGQKLPNGPDVRRKDNHSLRGGDSGSSPKPVQQFTDAPPSFSSHSSASSKARNQSRAKDRQTISTHANHSSQSQAPSSTLPSSTIAPPTVGRSYTSVNEKLFSRPPIRQSSVSSDGSRSHSTATECVRLDQLQQYQQLLQQFTTANVSVLSPTSSSIRVRNSGTRETTRYLAKRTQQESTELGSVIERPRIPANRSLHRTRVLPHQYESRQEVREAARQRLHAPVTDLSPSATPYTSRHTVATPGQPDFSVRSESPIIVSIKPAPQRSASRDLSQMTSFERSLTATPCAMTDWVKDLKERFESSVRLQHRNIEREKAALSLYKQQRDEQAARVSKKITEDMKLAERRVAVIEEPPTPEVSEEEDVEEIEEIEDEEEEEAEEELPEITDDMRAEIENALRPTPSSQVLVEGFRIQLTRNDMHTLYGLNWLNDEIINFYMSMLVERGGELGQTKLHCFNTFFYPKLLKEGHAGLRRWTKKTDIFAKNMILIPIHLGMHWCLAIIDFRKKSIEYFDSMGGENKQCLNALWDYLIAEHRDKKGSPYDMTGWRSSCRRDIPQQLNGSDCGMFACKFADYISRDKKITFTQHDMPYFRKRMVWELLHKKLL
ncbi:sentrin-specific protease 1-like [Acanthaster planci]|uniref:Sentrin-specific protease 1-like n=1 Tax=Acanthaster planci TaxID=133434 RepID=A0A8B7XS89_ACAPL|nr:sentrin-specific protease 1-like [Acanthaster planci]